MTVKASTVLPSTTSSVCCFMWQDGDAYDVEITDYH